MIKRKILRWLPTREHIAEHRFLGLFSKWLLHPALWRLSRRSVAGGVAAGLLCGLIPGPFQMLGAGLLAVAMRWNAAVGMAMTLYTNPVTIIPLYLVAYRLGMFILAPGQRVHMADLKPPAFDFSQFMASLAALWHWMAGLGWPLALGLVALGVLLAVIGYVLVWYGWSWALIRAWRRRQRTRAQRQGLARA
ncbi:MAG TPA: DUF2062 domain-containing protein [Burkholderiales bacterium]